MRGGRVPGVRFLLHVVLPLAVFAGVWHFFERFGQERITSVLIGIGAGAIVWYLSEEYRFRRDERHNQGKRQRR
jgi:hypothetical protein